MVHYEAGVVINGMNGFSAAFVNNRNIVTAHHIDDIRCFHSIGDAIHPAFTPCFIEQV